MRQLVPTVLFLLASLTLFVSQSTAASQPAQRTLYIMGDSWAEYMTVRYDTVQTEVVARGFDSFLTINDAFAISGTRVRGWLEDNPCQDVFGVDCPGRFSELQQTLADDPTERPTLFISLGGNDINNRYTGGGLSDPVFVELEMETRLLLQALVDVRPDLNIVWGSYDLLNYEQSGFCRYFGRTTFGTNEPTIVNRLYYTGFLRQWQVANDFPTVHYANVAGTLQGNPGNPDLGSYSPAQYITFDCIHLTADGQALHVEALFDSVLGEEDPLVDWATVSR